MQFEQLHSFDRILNIEIYLSLIKKKKKKKEIYLSEKCNVFTSALACC